MSGGYNSGENSGPAYSYTMPAGGYDAAGNVTLVNDSVNGAWNYSYDTLNRLTSATAGAGPFANNNGCWTYDGFGDRTLEAVPSSTPCNSPSNQTWSTFNTSNQITSSNNSGTPATYTYDAAGNVIYDGTSHYIYDGAGRQCAVWDVTLGTMTQYIYDAEGQRAAKGNLSSWPSGATCPAPTTGNGFTLTTQWVTGISGEQLSETSATNGWNHTNVFAAGGLHVTYSGTDMQFDLTDWLGTKRAVSGVSGCLTAWTNMPYGNQLNPAATGTSACVDGTEHHFTGKERDSESGNDYFGARYYASTMGRFLSPDWSAKATPVPYAKLDNPQSLNLYEYVLNNPLSRADADGHCDAPSNLKAGQVGVCVASYIAAKSFDVVGNGDNRGTNGNGGTSRIETTFTVDPNGGKTEKPADGDKVAQSSVLGMKEGLQGTGSSQVSPGATVDSNGNMHLSVDQSAHSAYDVGGALGDISNHVKLEVTPDGKVGVDAGSTARQFPSLEIYRYTTDGTTVTTTLVHNYPEASSSALRQPEQPLAPQAPQ